jgi:nitric oxide reductase NorQ protein
MARTISKERIIIGQQLRKMPPGLYTTMDLIKEVKGTTHIINAEMGAVVSEGHCREVVRGLYQFGETEEAPTMEQPTTSLELEIPALDGDYLMPEEVATYVSYLKRSMESGNHEHFRITGPKGTGKTEGGMQLAALLGLPCLVMDCSIIREPRDFFGMRDVRDGRTFWSDGVFTKTVEQGNAVIILDEINRASDMVGNALLPLLDRRRSTMVQERGCPVKGGPGIIWWATTNVGSIYTGTNALDAALQDRFTRVVEMDYLPPDKEAALLVARTGISRIWAQGLVEVATRTRQQVGGLTPFSTVLSTRQLIGAAHDLHNIGLPSLALTIGNLFSNDGGGDSERSKIMNLVVGKFVHNDGGVA